MSKETLFGAFVGACILFIRNLGMSCLVVIGILPA